MYVLQANCRVQFTPGDVDFILSCFSLEKPQARAILQLIADPEELDSILDDDRIYRALLERTGCLRVSRHFYFYVMVRHVFRAAGIDDTRVADYVAEMLAEFSDTRRARSPMPGGDPPMDHLTDMMAALQKVDDSTAFLIRAHMGNHSLFVSGVFPDHLRYRTRFRGAPQIEYYEQLGSANYRAASDHRLARMYELTAIFDRLSLQFHTIRLALNDMSDRLLSLGDPEPPPNLCD